MPYKKGLWVLCLAGAATVAPALALADSNTGEAARLLDSKKCEPYEVPVPGSSVRMGAARIAVQAPLRTVRSVLMDYGHYAEFLPEFQKSRVIGKNAGGTDVYLEVPILHGAARLWTVARFSGPVSESNGSERIEGRQQSQGNIDELRAVWRMHAPDDTHTILALELLLVPKLPVPASLLTAELREAAERAVIATRTRAEVAARTHSAAPSAVATP